MNNEVTYANRMTVGQLADELKKHNPELYVVVSQSKGSYTFLQSISVEHDDNEDIKDVLALTANPMTFVDGKPVTTGGVKYKIGKDGALVLGKEGEDSESDAIAARINELEDNYLAQGAELEIDWDDDRKAWMAMNYYSAMGQASPIEDKDGNPIIAFSGVNHSLAINVLDEFEIYYVY